MTEITAEVDVETLASLDSAARARGLSRGEFVSAAIARHVEETAEFLAFVQKGIDDIDAGRYFTHEELTRRLRARFEGRKVA